MVVRGRDRPRLTGVGQAPPPPVLTVPLRQDTMAVGSELQGLKVKRLYVGGLPPGSEEEVPRGLVGCIQVGVHVETQCGTWG